ncbi:MAG: hypothetical protein EZS28_039278 [Streblomastix strix]|uniref:RSE1/DDB1/CPSF1 C-terminal domain-containing protein n=1 Tax=Streblomastix strix TaxID=222440 RepID=A0A5J4U655_9EUKA|nr:MAG: hypothetical protein EZS28_039278 [Streblomastix strix]
MLTVRSLIIVTTSFVNGEDAVVYGNIHIFDVHIPSIPSVLYEIEQTQQLQKGQHRMNSIVNIDQGRASPFFGYDWSEEQSWDDQPWSQKRKSFIEQHKTSHRLKLFLLSSLYQDGAVLCSSQLPGGLLAVASRQHLVCYRLERSNKLSGVSTLEVSMYVHHIEVWRTLIILVDAMNCVQLVQWRADQRSLTPIAKSNSLPYPVSASFVIQDTQQSFIVSDQQGNIRQYNYVYENPLSISKDSLKLSRVSHVSGSGACTLSMPTGNNAYQFSDQIGIQERMIWNQSGYIKKRSVDSLGISVQGGLHAITHAIDDHSNIQHIQQSELGYILDKLNDSLLANMDFACGSNPVAFRTLHRLDRREDLPPDSFIDGNILCDFLLLDIDLAEELAKRVGSTRAKVLSILDSLNRRLCYVQQN